MSQGGLVESGPAELSSAGLSELIMEFSDDEVEALEDEGNLFRNFSVWVHSVDPASDWGVCKWCAPSTERGCEHQRRQLEFDLRLHGAAVTAQLASSSTHVIVSRADSEAIHRVRAEIEVVRGEVPSGAAARRWVEKHQLAANWVNDSIEAGACRCFADAVENLLHPAAAL